MSDLLHEIYMLVSWTFLEESEITKELNEKSANLDKIDKQLKSELTEKSLNLWELWTENHHSITEMESEAIFWKTLTLGFRLGELAQ